MVSKEVKRAASGGFQKWLHSTKFQICILAFGLLFLDLLYFGLDPKSFANSIVKISVGYFGARVLEPAAEMAATIFKKKKGDEYAND